MTITSYQFTKNKRKVTVDSTNQKNKEYAKLDSGATKHYLKTDHKSVHKNVLTDITKINNGPIATFPNKEQIIASHTEYYNLHPLLYYIVKTTYKSPKQKLNC